MKPQIVGWMGKRDASRGADTNYRPLEQDYDFSGGYGLREPAGWTPLYALGSKDLLILELYREQHGEALTTLRAATGKVRASAASLGLTIAEWEHKFGTSAAPRPQTQALQDVIAERQRQIDVEDWTPEHDDTEHDDGNLACAGAAYALAAGDALGPYSRGDAGFADEPPDFWPENWHWKPSNPRRMLVKAAALLLAEIERLDRAKEQQP